MLTLLSQARFLTLKDEIVIKDTDFGAFRYLEKKDIVDSTYNEGKRSFAEKRGITCVVRNKRPNKLRNSIKDLEEQLSQHKVIYCHWTDNSLLQLVLNSGLIVKIFISVFTGDIIKISFDKYLVGKLLSEYIADVIFTRTHLIFSYNDSQVTLVYFAKPLTNCNASEKINRLEPKVQNLELAGPSGRRLERKLSSNVGGDMILIWWRCTRDEVYPWSPVVKDQDRANVHVYLVNGIKLELICYYRTEFDPVNVSFSCVQPNVIHSVEQKVSRKGEVTVESCTYEISKSRLQRTAVTSVPLQTQVCCHSFSPDEEKLLLGCIDGSLVLFDEGRGVTHTVKATFISTVVSWHPDGMFVVVANERGQLQCFDIALGCIKNQLMSEDLTPSSLLDLGSYFKTQPTLMHMEWNKKAEVSQFSENYCQTDGFLLLHFERGPLAVVQLVGGGGLIGDLHGSGLTANTMVAQYLMFSQVDRAINLLLSLNWDSYGQQCISCLNQIVNYLFRHPLTPEREVQLQTALGSFLLPPRPLCHATEEEFGSTVRDLARRFFHHLLRHQSLDKAFRLAIDLDDGDLFADIWHCARGMGETVMADAARERARLILSRCSSRSSTNSGSSQCSRSCCSGCSGCESHGTTSEDSPEPPPQPPPPLPVPRQSGSSLRVPGEKPKVKFSDTVTHILVPDSRPSLTEEEEEFYINMKPSSSTIQLQKDQFRRQHAYIPDTKQELADSLPLCLGNKDYLKDFATAADISEEEENGNGTIKVVHFGVV